MNQRVAALRQQSLESKAYISAERAELITQFYREHGGAISFPVIRALSFKYMKGS